MENSLNFQINIDMHGKQLDKVQLLRLTQNIVNAIVNEAQHSGITPDDADETTAEFITVRQVESDQTIRATISDY